MNNRNRNVLLTTIVALILVLVVITTQALDWTAKPSSEVTGRYNVIVEAINGDSLVLRDVSHGVLDTIVSTRTEFDGLVVGDTLYLNGTIDGRVLPINVDSLER